MTIHDNDILHDFHNYGANIKTREIFLHNHHSSEENANPGVEYKMSNIFLKNLRSMDLKNNGDITVHMQSIGGEWADGMAIFDGIRMSKCKITIISYGQAESMSSIILQAADRRLLTPNSYFMVHYGSTYVGGNYLSVQNWIGHEKHLCDVMMDIYSDRCITGKYFKERFGNKPEQSKIKNFLHKKFKSGDWYMKAEEAVYYGFADGIINKWQ